MGCNDRKRMHAQMPARRRTRGRDLGLGRLNGPEDLAHAIEVDLSLGGQCQVPCGPIDEAHTEALLQYARIMQTKPELVTVAFRGLGEGGVWCCGAGEPNRRPCSHVTYGGAARRNNAPNWPRR